MNIALLGELAALGTALSWSFGSICFTISSRRIGHNVVNQLRLTIALVLLITAHYFIYHTWFPADLTTKRWLWLGLSGLIGFVVGDRMLLKCFVIIGPRLGMLMMALTPIFGVIIAWIFLSEALVLKDIMAIAVTLAGVCIVIFKNGNNKHVKGNFTNGVLLGIGAAFCQALGLILSKKGLYNDYPALSGNIIRVFVGVLFLWFVPFFRSSGSRLLPKLRDKITAAALFIGSFLGPFVGVWLSLVAVKYAHVGIASTLMALPPVFLIPLSRLIFKEKITVRAVTGTVVALVGVTLIFI
jgi:drug/metabolite transporter (DMT)-like permease